MIQHMSELAGLNKTAIHTTTSQNQRSGCDESNFPPLRKEIADCDPKYLTSAEIKKHNIPCSVPIPDPIQCPFCGKELYCEGIVINGIIRHFKGQHQRCTCDKAVKFWEQHDKEEAEKKAKEQAEKAEHERQENIKRRIENSGIQAHYKDLTFDNYKIKEPNAKEKNEAIDKAKTYVADFVKAKNEGKTYGKGLFIAGGVGTGKTMLASIIAHEIMLSDLCNVKFVTEAQVYSSIREAYNRSSGVSDSKIIKKYKTTPLLIIDDLGKEKPTDWSVKTLFDIIDNRYANDMPTIITTNFTADDLIQKLTPQNSNDKITATAIIDRLREKNEPIAMHWPSFRSSGQA